MEVTIDGGEFIRDDNDSEKEPLDGNAINEMEITIVGSKYDDSNIGE